MSQFLIKNEPINENSCFMIDTYSPERNFEDNYNKKESYDEKKIENDENFFILKNNSNYFQTENNTILNTEYSLLNKCDPINLFSSLEIPKTNLLNNEIISDSKEKKKKSNENKLIMNKISARKSRQKKKEYIKYLEEELVKLKNEKSLNNSFNEKENKNKKFFNNIIILENKEKEIYNVGQKKQSNLMKEYEASQKLLLKEMLIRQINNFIPLKFQIFGKKYIKLIPFSDDDSISVIITKINENLNKINNYMNNISKKRIKLVIKFYEIYKNIQNYTNNFNLLLNENFNY